jgi:hypothetical protein
MCYERRLRQHPHEVEESRELWQDFERSRPLAEPEAPAEMTEPERAEAPEEVTTAER